MNKTNTSKVSDVSLMTPFLQLVAQDLLKRFDGDLSNVVVVFPNKRARLFINDYIYREAGHPVWLPTYKSVEELFEMLSPYEHAERISAVCKLYQTYVRHTHSNDTLDLFYGWGERILSDFNDIDRNMVDAHSLFVNVADLTQIDMAEYVTEEQEAEIKRFFDGWSLEGNSEIKQKFLTLWQAMPAIYEDFRQLLFAEGLAYEGALQRDVVETLMSDAENTLLNDSRKTYAFVGFNALSLTEQRLLSIMQEAGKSLFYWDYDHYFTSDEGCGMREAGAFLRRNLQKFPNALPDECFDNLLSDTKSIIFASASTDSAQVKSAAEWLEHNVTPDERETAVVLCNENMLHPMLHNIPESIQSVNVTKGLPMMQTYACAFAVKQLDNVSIEETNQEMLRRLSDAVEAEAHSIGGGNAESGNVENTDVFAQMNNEAFFRLYTIINQFRTLVDSELADIGTHTLRKLIMQVLNYTTIPLHGEPARGVQVLGLLETRNLDFRHLLLLGCNEGMIPQNRRNDSFIPYFIRRSFGLTTGEERSAVSAFYFYRLLQRAESITLAYNSNTSGQRKGEMSRFMTQLLVDTDLPIRSIFVESHVKQPTTPPMSVSKTDEMLSRLHKLSPSAINTYLTCPLKFYLQRVCGIRQPDKKTEIIEPNVFGSIFHKAAELTYKYLAGDNFATTITSASISALRDRDFLLDEFVQNAFAAEEVPANIVVAEVVKRYVEKLLAHDERFASIEILSLEENYYAPFHVTANDRAYDVEIGGIIDRLDKISADDTLITRVVDYKTGGTPCSYNGMEGLFTPSDKRAGYIFQTFLYSLVLRRIGVHKHVAPALFYVHKSSGAKYTSYIKDACDKKDKFDILDFSDYADEFEEYLNCLLTEIFDKEKPFVQTEVENSCTFCDYRKICGK